MYPEDGWDWGPVLAGVVVRPLVAAAASEPAPAAGALSLRARRVIEARTMTARALVVEAEAELITVAADGMDFEAVDRARHALEHASTALMTVLTLIREGT